MMTSAVQSQQQPESRSLSNPRVWARWRLVPVLSGLLILLLAAFSTTTLNDGDTFSHVRTGLWIIDHHAVPHVDVFSTTFRGKPWTAHEWLAEVLFALAYLGGGWAGVMAITGAAAGAAGYLFSLALARRLDGVILLAASTIGVTSFMAGLLARPHMLALPVVILWVDRLITARRSGSGPGAAVMGLLMVIWANLHGGWAFGLAMLSLFTAERIVTAPGGAWERCVAARAWLTALLVSTVATVFTPNGIEGVLLPLRLSLMPNISTVLEWQSADFSRVTPLELILLGSLALGLTGRVRLDTFSTAILVLLAHMALQHRRHEILLGVTAPLLLADSLRAAPGMPQRLVRWRDVHLLAAAAGVAALTLRLATPVALADRQDAVPTALSHVPLDMRMRPVFNSYEFGGFLIFEGVSPYIDGRADMFGTAFMNDYIDTLSPDPGRFRDEARRLRVGWTLLRPSEPLVAFLDHEPGWRRIYADKYAVVHVHD